MQVEEGSPISSYIDIGFLRLDGDAGEPLHRRLYHALRDAILDDRLTPGARLPPTRRLSELLGLSRTVVVTAYEQLTAEGYLETRVGAGTFVAGALQSRGRPETPAVPSVQLSRRGQRLAASGSSLLLAPESVAPFRPGIPAIDAFPFELWGRIVSRCVREAPREAWSYGDARGYLPLRREIATYLGASRGVRCDADNVVIVSGTQQAIDLSIRLLLDPGDHVWFEEPGYSASRAALAGAGAVVVPVPVDDDGLSIEAALGSGVDARLVYLTPSHQYPLGSTMSVARRLRIIEWARAAGAWILEDDYDSEFRYEGRPIPALQGLDSSGRVIYLGTFSKVLVPGLRLGYLVLPPALVEPFTEIRALADRCPPATEQVALTRFMSEGHFARHIRRMRSLYEERRDALVETCRSVLEDLMTVESSAAGLHVVGFLEPGLSDRAISERAARAGLVVPPLSAYYLIDPAVRSGLLLGYGSVPSERMAASVERLRTVIEKTN